MGKSFVLSDSVKDLVVSYLNRLEMPSKSIDLEPDTDSVLRLGYEQIEQEYGQLEPEHENSVLVELEQGPEENGISS